MYICKRTRAYIYKEKKEDKLNGRTSKGRSDTLFFLPLDSPYEPIVLDLST